jgi:phosphate transport system substrate-binding protein
MRLWFCIALLASGTAAGDTEVDPALPAYRPVAGVVGRVACHSSAAVSELMTTWSAGFERIYPGARVELDDATVEDVSGGAATFGPRVGILPDALERFESRFGHAPTEIPVCLYALGVFVHRDNPYEGGLTIDELERVLSVHFKDQSWGDLGCGGEWSERPISLYAPRHHARWLLSQDFFGPAFMKSGVKEYSDDAAVVAAVADDIRAIGLASIGRQARTTRPLAIAKKGSAEFVDATAENARSGSYPLRGTFYLSLNHDPKGGFELDPVRREFLRYILSKEGQQSVVRAGFTTLSAEQAEAALVPLGLRPTGEGLWDEMVSRLRARGVSRLELAKIEQLARRVGDQPADEQLAELSNSLARTALTSAVLVATAEDGAVIKCRLFGQARAVLTLDQVKREATVPIGLYSIWTERDGKATSPTDAWFPVLREKEPIKIYETRERTHRPADSAVPD